MTDGMTTCPAAMSRATLVSPDACAAVPAQPQHVPSPYVGPLSYVADGADHGDPPVEKMTTQSRAHNSAYAGGHDTESQRQFPAATVCVGGVGSEAGGAANGVVFAAYVHH